MHRFILFLLIVIAFGGCKKEDKNTQNHLPKAAFSIIPPRNVPNEDIVFDAAIVSDNEDNVNQLQIRWSFFGGDTYDTPYSFEKQTSFTYSSVGVYFPRLQVIDTKSLSDTAVGMVVIVHDLDNLPPSKPIQIYPPEWEIWLEETITFKWTSGIDPEDDPLSFDLWVGKSINAMARVAQDKSDFILFDGIPIYEATIDNFLLNQDYYWQVAAKDPNGNYTLGNIWKFTTRPRDV